MYRKNGKVGDGFAQCFGHIASIYAKLANGLTSNCTASLPTSALSPKHLTGIYEDSGLSGSSPIRSLTALRKRCLQPKYRSVVCTEGVSQQECEPGFRTIPLDEFSDRMIIGSMGTGRCQAVQYCRFRLFKIGELENRFSCSFTLCFAACHRYGLLLPWQTT